MSNTLLDMLDVVDALPESRLLRARSYELLDLSAGDLVVDVGCGAGRAVGELAERGAVAVGVDLDPQMVDVARDRWPAAEFHVADAVELPQSDGVAAGYRADKVLHALAEPHLALAEAHRVLAPGGRAVLLGQDWDVLIIDSADPALTRTIVHARADTIATPRAARQYRNLLLDAGFVEPAVEVRTGVFTGPMMLPLISGMADAAHDAGAVSRQQADGWLAEQAERARTDRLFLAVPLFLVAARRAGSGGRQGPVETH